MSIIDKVTVGGTTYDVQDSAAVRFNEAQTLTDEQKRVARVNASAEEMSAVEIIPASPGYIRLENPSSDTAVTMDGTVPDITSASTAPHTPYYSLIEVQEGEKYSISCARVAAKSPGMLLIKADGTIIDRQVSAASGFQERVITIPSTAKWLYIAVNGGTSPQAEGTGNRFWRGAHTPFRLDALEAGKQDATVTETVSGTTVSITAQDNHAYQCGAVDELTITAPETGLFSVRWTANANMVLTLTGITMPEWWNGCATGRVYELSVLDGCGAVMSWATT